VVSALPRRRWLAAAGAGLLAACAASGLAGCADTPPAGDGTAAAGDRAAAGDDRPTGGGDSAGAAEPLLSRWRNVAGGFLAPPSPGVGLPPRPGTGMYVKLVGPTSVAMRGNDLLVLDAAAGRLWRVDTALNTLTGIAGAPTPPGAALALGADLSAWVLDPGARRVLRFGRDGRLLQSWPIDTTLPSPVALALADGGATLLVADGMGAQWAEQRSPGAPLLSILPSTVAGQRISGVDGLATSALAGRGSASDALWLLDRLGGVVHRAQRDGRVTTTLGRGELMQPTALAVDRFERVFVVDRQGRELVCLQAGVPARRFQAAALGLQQIGGLAIDDRLAVFTDPQVGQLVLHRLGRPGTP
jgi:sugar lactone lactonase YvrE